MRKRLTFVCLLLALSLQGFSQQLPNPPGTNAQASVPRLIRFTGQVTDASGTVGITFSLHKGPQDSAALWLETQNVKLDASGRYTVLLGATKTDGISMDLFASGEAQWLGVHVEGKPDQPRVLLVSVPYALKAAEAETLAGHTANEFVTGDKLNSVVQEQVQQAHFNTAPAKRNSVNGVLTSTATNFKDTTPDQVVGVTQSGAGKALVATATSNTAIYGNSTATSGSAVGVYGQSSSPSGVGLYGLASSTTGNPVALFGSTPASFGIAIAANETATSGNTTGVQASVYSPTGIAAIFQNKGSGQIISGRVGSSGTQVFSVDGIGNTTSAGQFISTIPQGTPPLSVASSTMVANLNAAYFAGHSPSDFVVTSAQNYFSASQSISGTNGFAGLTSTGGPNMSGGSGGDGVDASGGSGTIGGAGVTASGGNGTTGAGGNGASFLGGTSTSGTAGSGVLAYGAGASAGAAGDGIRAQGGSASGGLPSGGRGIEAQGGDSNLAGSGAGGAGGQFHGGNATASSGLNFGGTGIIANGGNATSGLGGDGLVATNGTGNANGYAAKFFGPTEHYVSGSSTAELNIGDPGCGAGWIGLGIGAQSGTTPFYMSNCNNYNLISNGTDLLLGVPTGGAIYFRQANGNQMSIGSSGLVSIPGTLAVGGAIFAGTKDFVIDHPLDPSNKLLYHTSIESPDMKTLYDGVIKLNAKGEAWVSLPEYFEALNQDFRYTLTSIGMSQPRIYVAREVKGNRFKIAGGRPNGKVSWQVTGIRHDAFAQANRGPVEVQKADSQRGKYLHPELFGASPEDAMTEAPDKKSSPIVQSAELHP